MRYLILICILIFCGCSPGKGREITSEERVEAWLQLRSQYYYAQGVRQFRDMEGLDGN